MRIVILQMLLQLMNRGIVIERIYGHRFSKQNIIQTIIALWLISIEKERERVCPVVSSIYISHLPRMDGEKQASNDTFEHENLDLSLEYFSFL